jgi:DNA-directed RNA polymerase subunit RPC12/RpoP
MSSKSKSSHPGGARWTIALPLLHIAFDLVTHAACPNCQQRVVLYVCPNCKKLIWPQRGQGAA